MCENATAASKLCNLNFEGNVPKTPPPKSAPVLYNVETDYAIDIHKHLQF